MPSRMRKIVDTISKQKQYFLRGHGSWFALLFSIINFSLIFYNLLFKNLFFIPEFLKHYYVFLIVFGLTYFPFAIFVGYYDYKKGTFKEEAQLQRRLNPVTSEMFDRLERIELKLNQLIEEN